MISDADRYYGATLNRIVNRWEGSISVQNAPESGPRFYLLNGRLPIFIKYSTSRRGPWLFTFHNEHQAQQENLFEGYGECLMAFVCGRDGIAALSHKEFRKVLDSRFEEQESVAIRRRHNEMYRISGRDGKLERKISRNSLAELLRFAQQTNL